MITNSSLRLLHIHNTGAELYVWRKRSLVWLARFSADAQGWETFEAELDDDATTPFMLLVDCIEEDFRHETVAHVRGRDRNSLLKRKLTFLFRSTPYSIASIVGREPDGRRDDRALFSALTRPELLAPWEQRILYARIAIKGITTPAYVLEQFARREKLRQEHLLLVNVESTGVRQTYLRKGKVMFSRLAPRLADTEGGFHEQLLTQAQQTRKYLERIKLVPYERELDVFVYSALDHEPAIGNETAGSHLRFHYVDTVSLAIVHKLPDHLLQGVGATAIALTQALRLNRMRNTYAPFHVRRYFHINQLRQLLVATGLLTVMASVASAAPGLIDAYNKTGDSQQIRNQTLLLQRDYEQRRMTFPQTPVAANTMAVVVETYDTVLSQAHSPVEAMALISEALQGAAGIRLTALDWQLHNLIEADTDIYGESVPAEVGLVNAVIAGDTQPRIVIDGLVENAASYQSAHLRVENFIALLRQTGEAAWHVTPISMPLAAETDSTLAARLDDNALNPSFRLQLSLGSNP